MQKIQKYFISFIITFKFAMQCGGEQIRKVLQAYNDWEGTVAEGAEEG